MVILTKVNVGGVNNFVAGPLYGFTIVLFSGPSQPMMASSGAQMMDPAVQQQGPAASAGFGMGGGGGAAQQRIQNLEQQLQREKELLAQQQQGSFIVGCVCDIILFSCNVFNSGQFGQMAPQGSMAQMGQQQVQQRMTRPQQQQGLRQVFTACIMFLKTQLSLGFSSLHIMNIKQFRPKLLEPCI